MSTNTSTNSSSTPEQAGAAAKASEEATAKIEASESAKLDQAGAPPPAASVTPPAVASLPSLGAVDPNKPAVTKAALNTIAKQNETPETAAGQAQVQEKMDVINRRGYHGVNTDPTPNSHYTFLGAATGKPTPETDPELSRLVGNDRFAHARDGFPHEDDDDDHNPVERQVEIKEEAYDKATA